MFNCFLLLVSVILIFSRQGEDYYSKLVYTGENGRLIYGADENGNTILDFSHCGYMGGGVKLPDLGVKVTLAPGDGDDGARIQAAINEVAKLPLDENGFRGAVLLKKGKTSRSIRRSESGDAAHAGIEWPIVCHCKPREVNKN
jgi:hypothetical protein